MLSVLFVTMLRFSEFHNRQQEVGEQIPPCHAEFNIVHLKYVEACQTKDPHMRFLKYKSFVSMWKQCLPDIVFMTPQSDVCATCEQFRIQIKDAVHEEEKVKLTTDFTSHVEMAQEERD